MASMVPQFGFVAGPLCLALLGSPGAAQEMDPDAPDYDPLEDDSLWDEPASPAAPPSTSPELRFLLEAPERTPHHHQNEIRLTASSLEDGWVDLRQCHSHVTAIRRMVIVYNEETIDALRVESTRGIEAARADEDRVDLRGVERDAEVCITARMRILEEAGDGVYELVNGPFQRKFLDSYLPMRVTLAVSWGELDMRLEATEPREQEGFEVVHSDHGFMIDTVFKGELRTRMHLRNHH